MCTELYLKTTQPLCRGPPKHGVSAPCRLAFSLTTFGHRLSIHPAEINTQQGPFSLVRADRSSLLGASEPDRMPCGTSDYLLCGTSDICCMTCQGIWLTLMTHVLTLSVASNFLSCDILSVTSNSLSCDTCHIRCDG